MLQIDYDNLSIDAQEFLIFYLNNAHLNCEGRVNLDGYILEPYEISYISNLKEILDELKENHKINYYLFKKINKNIMLFKFYI